MIQRFGIELELGNRDGDGHYEYTEVEEDCDCGNSCCSGTATYSQETWIPTGATKIIERFHGEGLTAHDEMCPYHCRCEMCYYDREHADDNFFATQADCSVAVEFVSRIADFGDWPTVQATAKVLDDLYRNDVNVPRASDPWGNHIHVEHLGNGSRIAIWANALFCDERFDWERLSSGGRAHNRGYNAKPSKNGGWDRSPQWGNWVSERSDTVEFRLWNTPVEGKWIMFHVAASVALARWGATKGLVRDMALAIFAVEAMTPDAIVAELADVWPDVPERDDHLAHLRANVRTLSANLV